MACISTLPSNGRPLEEEEEMYIKEIHMDVWCIQFSYIDVCKYFVKLEVLTPVTMNIYYLLGCDTV
jgi:hypothetical protein